MLDLNLSFLKPGLIVLNSNIDGSIVFNRCIDHFGLNNSIFISNDLSVDKMRDVNLFLSRKSDKKLVLIDKAHKMNKFSANSILKSTENLDDSSTVILITNKKHMLLKTILSRALKYDLEYKLKNPKVYLNLVNQKFFIGYKKNGALFCISDLILEAIENPIERDIEVYSLLKYLFNCNFEADIKAVDFSDKSILFSLKESNLLDSLPEFLIYIIDKIIQRIKLSLVSINKLHSILKVLNNTRRFDIKSEFVIFSIISDFRSFISNEVII